MARVELLIRKSLVRAQPGEPITPSTFVRSITRARRWFHFLVPTILLRAAPSLSLFRSVAELELSVRASNCLKSANIRTIAELVPRTEAELLKTKKLRQEIAQRDHDDPRGDGPLAWHVRLDPEEFERLRAQYERAGEA